MPQGLHRADKDEAWRQGKDSSVSRDAFLGTWMADKYGLPHGMKLQTLFFDARENTTVLARYTAAEARILHINMASVPRSRQGAMTHIRCARLKELIRKTDIDLPDAIDITRGPALFNDRAQGATKDRQRREQHTYRTILDKVANLMSFVADIYEDGIANVTNKGHEQVLEMRALENVDFLKCIRGYSAGICHKEMHVKLKSKADAITGLY